MKFFNMCLFLLLLIVISKSVNSSFLKDAKQQQETSKDYSREANLYKGYCFMKMKNNFFDLNPLNSIKPYHLKSNNGQLIYFNFCSNIETSCVHNEAIVVSKERCKRFSDSSDQEKTWVLTEDSEKNSVITVNLPNGDICERKNDRIVQYSTKFEITCDKSVNDLVITNEKEFDSKKCENIIKIRSKHGKIMK